MEKYSLKAFQEKVKTQRLSVEVKKKTMVSVYQAEWCLHISTPRHVLQGKRTEKKNVLDYCVCFNGDIRFKGNVTNLQKVGKPHNRSGLELISQLRATLYLHVGNSAGHLNPPHHGYSCMVVGAPPKAGL